MKANTSPSAGAAWIESPARSGRTDTMASHRIQSLVPEFLQTLDEVEAFSLEVASFLLPGVGDTLGLIYGADNNIISWTAYGWQADGTFVAFDVNPHSRIVSLYLDTEGLAPPAPPLPKSVTLLFWLIVLASLAVGAWWRSIWLSLGFFVVGVGIWVGVDTAKATRARQRRNIDTVFWDHHFADVLAKAPVSLHR